MSVRLWRKSLLSLCREGTSRKLPENLWVTQRTSCCIFEDTNIRLRGWWSYLQEPSGRTPTDRTRRSDTKLGRISAQKPMGTTPQATTLAEKRYGIPIFCCLFAPTYQKTSDNLPVGRLVTWERLMPQWPLVGCNRHLVVRFSGSISARRIGSRNRRTARMWLERQAEETDKQMYQYMYHP